MRWLQAKKSGAFAQRSKTSWTHQLVRQATGLVSDYKNSFFRAVELRAFLFGVKELIPLAGMQLFSQRFINQENRVNPTVGFRIRFALW